MAKKDTSSSNRKLHKDFEDMDDLDSLMLQIQLEVQTDTVQGNQIKLIKLYAHSVVLSGLVIITP